MFRKWWFWTAVGVLAVGIAIKLRFGSHAFRLNGLDVLVVLIIAIVPNMPFVTEMGLPCQCKANQ